MNAQSSFRCELDGTNWAKFLNIDKDPAEIYFDESIKATGKFTIADPVYRTACKDYSWRFTFWLEAYYGTDLGNRVNTPGSPMSDENGFSGASVEYTFKPQDLMSPSNIAYYTTNKNESVWISVGLRRYKEGVPLSEVSPGGYRDFQQLTSFKLAPRPAGAPDHGANPNPTNTKLLQKGLTYIGKEMKVSYKFDDNYFRTYLDQNKKITKLYKAKQPDKPLDGPVVTVTLDSAKAKDYPDIDYVSFDNSAGFDERFLDAEIDGLYAQLFTSKVVCTQASATWATWVTTCDDTGWENAWGNIGTYNTPTPDFPVGTSGGTGTVAPKKYIKVGDSYTFNTNLIKAAEVYGLNKLADGKTSQRNEAQMAVGFEADGTFGINGSDVWFLSPKSNKPPTVYVEVYKDKAEFDAHINDDPPKDIEANNAVSSAASDVGECKSNSLVCFLRDVVVFIVALLRELVYTIFFFVVLPLMQAVLGIRTYTDTFASVIYPGWVIIRNLCNIFLILAMLVIGLATLFRVDGYNYKQLLVKVILAALFVNFSLVFGQAVLGIADTALNQFLPKATEPLNQLGGALMVGNTACTGDGFCSWTSASSASTSGFGDIIYSIFQLALAIGSLIAFVAITVLLIVRMMALWILLMVSPVAWVADVLPATSKYRGEWWGNFLKYAFFAPIMGFFLNLTAVISLTLHDKLIQLDAGNFAGNELSNFIFQVATNVLLIAFLVAAVMVAQSFGIKLADTAVSAVTKGLKSPFGALAWAGKFGAGRGLSYLNRKRLEKAAEMRGHSPKVGWTAGIKATLIAPDAFVKGWQKHQEALQHRAHERAETAGREIAEQFLTKGRKIVPRTENLHEKEVDEEMKNFIGMDRNRMVKEGVRINKMGNSYDEQLVKQGYMKALMANGYWDDYVTDSIFNGDKPLDEKFYQKMMNFRPAKKAELDEDGDATGKLIDVTDDDIFYTDEKTGKKKLAYNQITRGMALKALLGDHNQEGLRIMRDAGEKYGKETGHMEYMNVVEYDEDKEHYHLFDVKTDKGDSFAATELSKMDSRSQARAAWHSIRNIMNGDAVNKKMYKVIAKALYENAPFAQERNARNIITLGGDLKVQTTGPNKGLAQISEDDYKTLQTFAKVMPEGLVGQVQRAIEGDYLPGTTRNIVYGDQADIDKIPKLSPMFKEAGVMKVLVEKVDKKTGKVVGYDERKINIKTTKA